MARPPNASLSSLGFGFAVASREMGGGGPVIGGAAPSFAGGFAAGCCDPLPIMSGSPYGAPAPYFGVQAPAPTIGFTTPTVIYEKMRDIAQSAASLDMDVQAHVADPVFVAGWRGWYANWRLFFDRYQTQTAKAGALFYTDELNRQVESYRIQLLGWYADYQRQKTRAGQPVPPTTGQPPTRAPEDIPSEPRPGTGWSLPWWVWLAGGAIAVGGAYWLYKTYLGKPIAIAKAAFAGDVEAPARLPRHMSDADAVPLSLDEVAVHPRALRAHATEAVMYRPYEHPHLVAARDRAARGPMRDPMRARHLRPRRPPPSMQGAAYADDYAERDYDGGGRGDYGYAPRERHYAPDPHDMRDVYEGTSSEYADYDDGDDYDD